MKKISQILICCLFLAFLLMNPAVFAADTGTGTDEVNNSGQIVPPIDASMTDVVAFDISKDQWTDDCPDFIADLQSAGYTVATVDISSGIPTNVMKLVILGLRGNVHITSPYTASEGIALASWVSSGGELLLLGDHTSYGADTEELFKAFGVTPNKDGVQDPTDYDTNPIWVVYQSDNFAVHPIFTGVTSTVHLLGESLDPSSGAIITADADATPSEAIVAVALDWGSGRVAMFGDTNWVCYFASGYGKADNAKVALNTIYWLNEREPTPGVPEFETSISVLFSICVGIYVLHFQRKKYIKR